MENKRFTRDNWLQLALDALSRGGVDALKIDNICKLANKTRGSFYHHFTDHNKFIVSLLEYWHENSTALVIDAVKDISDPRQQRAELAKQIVELSATCENAIRGWAGTDERARKVVRQVDKMRLEFLQTGIVELAKEFDITLSPRQSHNLAVRDYGLFIGVLAIKPDASKDYCLQLNELSEDMLRTWLGNQGKKLETTNP